MDGNLYLQIKPEYVEHLCSIDEFRFVPTAQLLSRIPLKYRKYIPPAPPVACIGADGEYPQAVKRTRAAIIGMLI